MGNCTKLFDIDIIVYLYPIPDARISISEIGPSHTNTICDTCRHQLNKIDHQTEAKEAIA